MFRRLLRLAMAFEDVVDPNVEAPARARGSKWFTAAAIILIAVPMSSLPRLYLGVPMSQSLPIVLAVFAALALLLSPWLGFEERGWRALGSGTLIAGALGAFAYVLLRVPALESLPAGSGGDGGNHIWFEHLFVDQGIDEYGGMLGMYVTSHWFKTLTGADDIASQLFGMSLGIGAVFALVALVIVSGATSGLHRLRPSLVMTIAALSFVPGAFFVVLPLLHYYGNDGFFPQVFSLLPVAASIFAYAVVERRALRLLVVLLSLVCMRYTYVLNAADLAFAFAVSLFCEAWQIKHKRWLRIFLVVIGFALLGVGAAVLRELLTVFKVTGGFRPAPLTPQLLGLGVMVVVFASFGPAMRWLNVEASPVALRAARLLASFCAFALMLVSAWLLLGHEPTYYIRKYAFCACVVGMSCVLPMAVVFASAVAASTDARARDLASAWLLAAVVAMTALGSSAHVYAAGFHERLLGPPFTQISPHADRHVWRSIESTLARKNAQFGGFLTTRWPELQFTNAHFRVPTFREFDQAKTIEDAGYCVFWYALDSFPDRWHGRWQPRVGEAAERLHATTPRTCESFRPAYDPSVELSLCHYCFTETPHALDLTGERQGFYYVEQGADGGISRWTDGHGHFRFTVDEYMADKHCTAMINATGGRPFDIGFDGRNLGTGPNRAIPVMHKDEVHEIDILSPTFVPASDGVSTDQRSLGVMVHGISMRCLGG